MNLKGLIVTFTVKLGSETRSVMAAALCFSSAGSLLQHYHKIYVRTDLQWVQDAMEISDERQVKKRPSREA